MGAVNTKVLIDKITALPPEQVEEVEAFVDAITDRRRDRALAQAAAATSAPSFAVVWNNPEDDVYDDL